jgi:thiamine-phosphate pyrophosphorylase
VGFGFGHGDAPGTDREVEDTWHPPSDWRTLLLDQVRGAIAGGIDVVQIRERGIDDRDYVAVIRASVGAARGTGTRIVVNDRLDLALAAGAHGVHLRERSIGIEAARRLSGKDFLIGRSVHDAATAARTRTADYMIAGSVFETASKPGQAASLGLEGLRTVVAAAGECPVWAIGGVTAANVGDLARCGARGMAAIGAFLPLPGTTDIAGAVQQLAQFIRQSAIS